MSDYDHDGEESFDQCELDGNGRCYNVHPGMSHREYEREQEIAYITRQAANSPQARRAIKERK